MKKLTIGKKIVLGFSIVLIILGISTFISYFKIGEIAFLAGIAQKGVEQEAFIVQKEVDHLNWAGHLSDSVINDKDITIELDAKKCDFGKWLYKALEENSYSPKIMEVLRRIEPIHKKLHDSAHSIRENHVKFDMSIEGLLADRWVDHLLWIKNLQLMFLTGKRFEGGLDPKQCRFGKWFYTYVAEDKRFGSLLAAWEEPHNRLHQSAGKILNLWDANKKKKAKAVFENETLKALDELTEKYNSTMAYIQEFAPKKRAVVKTYKEESVPSLHGVQSQLHDLTNAFHEHIIETVGSAAEDVEGTAASTQIFVLIFGICALITGVSLAIFITKSIVGPIRKVTDDIGNVATNVASASGQLSNAAQELSSGANEQASSIEETSSSLEEMNGMIQNNVNNAEQAYKLSSEVKSTSESSNESMKELEKSMSEILASNEKIKDLVKVIGNIGEKTQVMDEIVFQTKLLSFNASVEAERAGEHGRGFAVVAQEVGNLAQMSGQAAQEIASIVKGSIKNAEEITAENKKRVEQGKNYVDESSNGLKEIMQSSNTVASGSSHVLEASKEQASGIKQITVAMNQLDKATQENAATAEETASSSEELNAQAEVLSDCVGELLRLVDGKDVRKELARENPGLKNQNTNGSGKKAKVIHLDNHKKSIPKLKKAVGSDIDPEDDNKNDKDAWEKL